MLRSRSLQARTWWLIAVLVIFGGGAAASTATLILNRNTQFNRVKNGDAAVQSWIDVSDAISVEISAAPAARPAAIQTTDARLPQIANTAARTKLAEALTAWRAQRTDANVATVRSDIRGPRAQAVETAARTTKNLEDSFHRVTVAVLGTLVLFALMLTVTVGQFRRWTRQPLRTLSTSIRLLTHGHLTEPVLAQGPQEFQQLGIEIEQLRLTLLREHERSTQAEEALAQAPPVLEALRQQLVPTLRLPDLDGLSVGFSSSPAEGVVAGDWCDLIQLDGGLIGVIIGDVSGHGVDPGLVALQTKLLIAAALKRGLEPSRALQSTQDQLVITDDVIVTVWVGVINPHTLSLRYACAGHPPGWHCAATGQITALASNGTLISTLGGRWATEEMRLEPRSTLVLLTDGVLESRDGNNVEFGEESVLRTVTLALQRHDVSAQDISENVLLAARQHCAGRLTDDGTVLVVQADG